MVRDFTQPFVSAVLHLGLWIESLGHRLTDDGRALGLQQFVLPLLRLNHPVNLAAALVEISRDPFLFRNQWNGEPRFREILIGNAISRDARCTAGKPAFQILTAEQVLSKTQSHRFVGTKAREVIPEQGPIQILPDHGGMPDIIRCL